MWHSVAFYLEQNFFYSPFKQPMRYDYGQQHRLLANVGGRVGWYLPPAVGVDVTTVKTVVESSPNLLTTITLVSPSCRPSLDVVL